MGGPLSATRNRLRILEKTQQEISDRVGVTYEADAR